MKKSMIACLLVLGCVSSPAVYAEEAEKEVVKAEAPTPTGKEEAEAAEVAKNEVPAKDCGCTKKPKA